MRITRLIPFVAVLTLVPACGDDGAEQIQLTTNEKQQLFVAISDIFGQLAGFSVASPGLSLSLAGVLQDINETVSCPQGGTASVTGTDNSTVSTIDFDADLDFNSCGSQGFTIGGGLNFSGSGTETETGFSLTIGINGDLQVDTGSNSGVCTWDVDYDIDVDGESLVFSVSGSVCGDSFNYSGGI
jgi:hypothetical protein